MPHSISGSSWNACWEHTTQRAHSVSWQKGSDDLCRWQIQGPTPVPSIRSWVLRRDAWLTFLPCVVGTLPFIWFIIKGFGQIASKCATLTLDYFEVKETADAEGAPCPPPFPGKQGGSFPLRRCHSPPPDSRARKRARKMEIERWCWDVSAQTLLKEPYFHQFPLDIYLPAISLKKPTFPSPYHLSIIDCLFKKWYVKISSLMASLGFHFSSVMPVWLKNKPFSLINLSFCQFNLHAPGVGSKRVKIFFF